MASLPPEEAKTQQETKVEQINGTADSIAGAAVSDRDVLAFSASFNRVLEGARATLNAGYEAVSAKAADAYQYASAKTSEGYQAASARVGESYQAASARISEGYQAASQSIRQRCVVASVAVSSSLADAYSSVQEGLQASAEDVEDSEATEEGFIPGIAADEDDPDRDDDPDVQSLDLVIRTEYVHIVSYGAAHRVVASLPRLYAARDEINSLKDGPLVYKNELGKHSRIALPYILDSAHGNFDQLVFLYYEYLPLADTTKMFEGSKFLFKAHIGSVIFQIKKNDQDGTEREKFVSCTIHCRPHGKASKKIYHFVERAQYESEETLIEAEIANYFINAKDKDDKLEVERVSVYQLYKLEKNLLEYAGVKNVWQKIVSADASDKASLSSDKALLNVSKVEGDSQTDMGRMDERKEIKEIKETEEFDEMVKAQTMLTPEDPNPFAPGYTLLQQKCRAPTRDPSLSRKTKSQSAENRFL